ncbi:MAG: sulfur carrier protein ThiS [Bradymonadaceae bacterium]
MHVRVNGERRQFAVEELTVDRLLEELDIEQRQGLAVAVNEQVVTRSNWEETTVGDGDEVEIIRATQGG